MRLMKMRGITTTVALSLAMVAIGAGPVLAFTPPAVTDAPSLEHDAVVSVAIWGGSPGCTGVLVTPTLVLTAGHCLGRGTIDGGSGIWNSQAPAFRPYEVNAPDPAPGWVTGLKGSSIITADQRFPSAQRYRSESVASAASCRAACDAESVCHGWDYESASTTCELMQERMVVYFGNNHSAFTYQAVSSSYSLPGRADIAMLKLDAPVPANVATPVPVMTYNYSTQAGIHDFLAAQTYQAVGNSPARTTRQTVAMTFNQYPLNGTDLMMVRMAGAGGSTVEGGDSGSPLFILRQMPDGSTKRFVIGICQGIEGGGGRYTLTGANLARQGELLQFIYNPATVDRTQAAPVGEWLDNLMFANFKSLFSVIPLYGWFNGARGDNFLSSDRRWVSDPRGAVPAGRYLWPQREQEYGYTMFRLEGYAFDPRGTRPAGTVPIWSWYASATEDNFATTDPQWSISGPLVWSGENLVTTATRGGYFLYRMEGYIYDPHLPQPANTTPLWSWYSPARGDNFATTDPFWSMDPAAAVWNGEHISNGPSRDGYTLYRLEGYVPTTPR